MLKIDSKKLFQFLIGTIKTRKWKYYISKEWEFQFLIGTIKTSKEIEVVYAKVKFQFLIGTIKTNVVQALGTVDYQGFNSL